MLPCHVQRGNHSVTNDDDDDDNDDTPKPQPVKKNTKWMNKNKNGTNKKMTAISFKNYYTNIMTQCKYLDSVWNARILEIKKNPSWIVNKMQE